MAIEVKLALLSGNQMIGLRSKLLIHWWEGTFTRNSRGEPRQRAAHPAGLFTVTRSRNRAAGPRLAVWEQGGFQSSLHPLELNETPFGLRRPRLTDRNAHALR